MLAIFRVGRLVMLGIVLAALPAVTAAQGISQQQADEILKELKAIRQLLERQPAPAAPRAAGPPPPERVKLAATPGFVLGRDDAPVTLVEFTDLECPFCRQFHVTTFEEIKKNYIDTGKVRFVTRDFPLDFHRNAMPAAQAARCAGDQKKFWEMRHVLSVNASNLGRDAIASFARDLGLDMNQFTACLTSEKYKAVVQKDMADALAMGVTGTPTFVLGKTSKDGGLEGLKIVGAQPYSVFDARIQDLLRP